MFIKIERSPGNPTSYIFRCFRSFFTDINCSQSLPRENFTITLSLSFLRRWHASMPCGDTSLPVFWKWSALCLPIRYSEQSRISTTSRHSLLEYWAFAQHGLSISTNLFDNNQLARFTTVFSASRWLNFWFTWRTWSRTSLFADSTFLWSDSRIVMSSFLFNLSKASSI